MKKEQRWLLQWQMCIIDNVFSCWRKYQKNSLFTSCYLRYQGQSNMTALHRIFQDKAVFNKALWAEMFISGFHPVIPVLCLSKYRQYVIHSVSVQTQTRHNIITSHHKFTFANEATYAQRDTVRKGAWLSASLLFFSKLNTVYVCTKGRTAKIFV